MQINDSHLFDFMQDVNQKLGQLLEGQKNQTAYINSVSKDTKEIRVAFEDHKDDIHAHGIASSDRSTTIMIAWGGLILSMIVSLVEVVRAFNGKG